MLKTILFFLFLNSTNILATTHPDICHNNENIQCEEIIMNSLSPWQYDEINEYLQIRQSCIGNQNTICLNTLMKEIPNWEKDNLAELTSIAQSCKYNNNECLYFAMKNIPKYDYNSRIEINSIAQACANSSINCIEKICSSRNTRCNRTHEIIWAIKTCQTPCN